MKTPIGKWELGKIFIRKDKIRYLKVSKNIRSKIFYIKKTFFGVIKVVIQITINFLLTKKNNDLKICGYENLYRQDDAYDMFIEIKHNQKPIIKNKGSAIFIHCSFTNLGATAGCVALKKKISNF